MSINSMMKPWATTAILVVILFSCASSGPVKQPDGGVGGFFHAPFSTIMDIFKSGPSDADLIHMAVRFLGEPGEANEQQARTTLDSLIRLHPKSKWKDTAMLLLKLLDERKELLKQNQNERGMVETLQGKKDELQHEAEQLKKDLQSLQDKFQTETARFQQENDLLKKDIERLKSLEIELQERGKILR